MWRERRLRADNKFHEERVCIPGGGEDVVRRNTPDIRISEYRGRSCGAACKDLPLLRGFIPIQRPFIVEKCKGLKDIADLGRFESNID